MTRDEIEVERDESEVGWLFKLKRLLLAGWFVID